jgi:MFS family permease
MVELTAQVAPEITRAAPEHEAVYRRNFKFFLADFVLFSIGMGLIGASTVIPDFVRHLTGSEVLIGLSSQLFEIGWLMPQLLVARRLVRVTHKKMWFLGPNIPVRFVILVLAGVIVLLGEERPGPILAAFLICYGIAAVGDGLVGVPWLDLVGSSLDSRRRARLFGWGTALVGVLMIGLTQVVRLILSDRGPGFPENYALLFGLAGLLFASTIPLALPIRELPGGKARPSSPSVREYLPDLWRVLRQDRPFRAMIITRVLSSLFTLATPFYIGFATVKLKMASDVAVSNLLLMQTLGNVTGSLLFSWLGDRRNLLFIRLALLSAGMQPVMALLASAVGPGPLYVGFFAAGIAQGSLVFAFLNWVVGYTTPDQRPIYSGLFNSVSAVSLLAAPLAGGSIVQELGYETVFAVALVIILAAIYVAMRHIRQPQAARAAP